MLSRCSCGAAVRLWSALAELCVYFLYFFFKQKTAYEMRISDWSSDVCSSDLGFNVYTTVHSKHQEAAYKAVREGILDYTRRAPYPGPEDTLDLPAGIESTPAQLDSSEEHTSELPSLMRISYAVFRLKKKTVAKKTNDTKTLTRNEQKSTHRAHRTTNSRHNAHCDHTGIRPTH